MRRCIINNQLALPANHRLPAKDDAMSLTRRRFLEDSLLATAAAAAASAPRTLIADDQPAKGPNDRITAAIIGCGVRGKQHASELGKLADCQIAYVCDPDSVRAGELAATIGAKYGKAPKAVQDLRRVYDDKTVDVVFIAAPNHWHALAAIWAMQASKDVYVEKPVSHNISEGRRIVQAARKLGRICQGGTQYRSSGSWIEAIEYLRAGKLGDVKLAKSIVYGRRGSIGKPGKYEVPASVDYNLFAGPAPLDPLTRPQLHYDWHWVWNTGNGELGNNNIHTLDICRWGLGVSGLGREVISYGGRLGYEDAGETPNTQVCIFDFGDKTIVAETRGLKTEPFKPKNGCVFYGSEGIIAGGSLFDLEGKLVRDFGGKSHNHFANFLKAVRSRKVSDQNADIAEGHQSTALCHAGNISYRLGRPASPDEIQERLGQLKVHENVQETFARTRQHLADNKVDLQKTRLTLGMPLRIDGDRESFLDNSPADAMLTRDYRRPFVVPGESEV
jgi:predicted dehydrogenase